MAADAAAHPGKAEAPAPQPAAAAGDCNGGPNRYEAGAGGSYWDGYEKGYLEGSSEATRGSGGDFNEGYRSGYDQGCQEGYDAGVRDYSPI